MEKKKIYLARPIDPKGLEKLKAHEPFEVSSNPKDMILSQEELVQNAKGSEALVSLLTDQIDGKVMDSIGKNLKIIANYSVGFDNIDLEAAKARGIVVTNTPEVMTQSVAEHAMGLILACARRIVEGDRFVREKKYEGWDPELLLGPEIAGKTLGIVGIGRIGSALAYIGYHGFGMKIVYSDIARNEEIERNLQADHMSLNTLLERSDFISLHVPLLDTTRHMIGSDEFKMMKKSAILVNTARGAIVEEKALVHALESGEIFAAGLDVFENEKTPEDNLLKLNNVVLTPHIASSTHEARQSMAVCVAENIIEVLNGRPAKTPVK
jgi:glyoxylate reductase